MTPLYSKKEIEVTGGEDMYFHLMNKNIIPVIGNKRFISLSGDVVSATLLRVLYRYCCFTVHCCHRKAHDMLLKILQDATIHLGYE